MNDTKPYPGIPAGVLDEELEKHVSKPKGPFEASLNALRRKWSLIRGSRWAKKDYKDAIHTLEAAGKVDKGRAIRALATLLKSYVESGDGIPELERDLRNGAVKEIRALLETLPDGGKP